MKPAPGFPPVGLFDSGVGGLSVLRAVRTLLPHHPVFFVADQGHVPYGPRPMAEVRAFSEEITRFLLNLGAGVIVVACNTASAAALHPLREKYPLIPFVGMEPAVKPAAEQTHTGKVGVLATPATFQGELYASVVERFAGNVRLFQNTCPGLVQQIEAGDFNGPATRKILEDALFPMLAEGIDTVVLGCTHYPFVIPLIQEITGPEVRVIDPAPAVARQTVRLLELLPGFMPGSTPAPMRCFTSGSSTDLRSMILQLLGETVDVESVEWNDLRISIR
ncbi:MAG: glutamate racemase [Anaerolineaceae bacterium]|nr:glutamate racemase [Anaerolineaceae bacterium]